MMKFDISTKSRESLSDVTSQVREAINKSGVSSGLCLVYCPHTTAGITINENADPDVPRDILYAPTSEDLTWAAELPSACR